MQKLRKDFCSGVLETVGAETLIAWLYLDDYTEAEKVLIRQELDRRTRRLEKSAWKNRKDLYD